MNKKQIMCWCCNEFIDPSIVQKYGYRKKYNVCPACLGTLIVIDSRLDIITRSRSLPPELTAKRKTPNHRKK